MRLLDALEVQGVSSRKSPPNKFLVLGTTNLLDECNVVRDVAESIIGLIGFPRQQQWLSVRQSDQNNLATGVLECIQRFCPTRGGAHLMQLDLFEANEQLLGYFSCYATALIRHSLLV